MIVLDRQTASSQEPAKFFMTKFLGAEHFGDSTEMTRDFYSVGVRTVERLRPTIGHKKAEDLRKSIDAALKGNSVDVEQWVDNLCIAASHKTELRAAFEAVIPDGQFNVDEQLADSMVKKRVFKAHGFRMTIDTDEYDAIVQKIKDEGGYVEFVLRIPDLEEFVR